MEPTKLKVAIEIANRFIRCVREAEVRLVEEDMVRLTGCKETGACRRASMDLTRALADLRKYGR